MIRKWIANDLRVIAPDVFVSISALMFIMMVFSTDGAAKVAVDSGFGVDAFSEIGVGIGVMTGSLIVCHVLSWIIGGNRIVSATMLIAAAVAGVVFGVTAFVVALFLLLIGYDVFSDYQKKRKTFQIDARKGNCSFIDK